MSARVSSHALTPCQTKPFPTNLLDRSTTPLFLKKPKQTCSPKQWFWSQTKALHSNFGAQQKHHAVSDAWNSEVCMRRRKDLPSSSFVQGNLSHIDCVELETETVAVSSVLSIFGRKISSERLHQAEVFFLEAVHHAQDVPSIFVIFFARSGPLSRTPPTTQHQHPTSLVTLLPGPSQTYRMSL